jgi:hypothetical protein
MYLIRKKSAKTTESKIPLLLESQDKMQIRKTTVALVSHTNIKQLF